MAAREEVNVRMTSEDAQLVAAWQRAKQGPDGMEKEMDKLGRTGKKSGNDIERAFSGVVTQFTTIGGAMGIARQALEKWMEVNKQFQEQSAKAGVEVDTAVREYTGRAGISDEGEIAKVRESFRKETLRSARPVDEIGAAAVALEEQGFSPKEVQGGALKALMATAQATGSKGGDLENLAETMALFAQGREKTEESMMEIGAQITAMTAGTDVKPGQIKDFSNRMLAPTSKNKKALAMLNMKPEDVDLVGENPFEVMQRFKQGLGSVDKATGQKAMGMLVPRKDLDDIMEMIGRTPDTKAAKEEFQKKVEAQRTGDAADVMRAEQGRKFSSAAQGGAKIKAAGDNLAQASMDAGEMPITTWIREGVFAGLQAIHVPKDVALERSIEGVSRAKRLLPFGFMRWGEEGRNAEDIRQRYNEAENAGDESIFRLPPIEPKRAPKRGGTTTEDATPPRPGGREVSMKDPIQEKLLAEIVGMRQDFRDAASRTQKIRLEHDGTQRAGRRMPEQLNERGLA